MTSEQNNSKNSIYVLIFFSGITLLIYSNYANLWVPLMLYLLFIMGSFLERVLLEPKKTYMLHIILFIKILLALSCSLFAKGYGPLLLFYFLLIKICRERHFLYSGIVGFFLLSIVIAREVVFKTLFVETSITIIFHLLIFTTIYLLLIPEGNEAKSRKEKEQIISQLRTSRKKLQDSNALIRRYSKQVKEMTKLQERSRISKGVHDILGHTFTAILVQLNAALDLLAINPKESSIKIANARNKAKEGLNNVRETIQMLDKNEMSLKDELKQIIKDAETNMHLSVIANIEDISITNIEKQELLCSCLREGLTNGVRHGNSTAFVFKLEYKNQNITFYLEDNGIGCSDINPGYGLLAATKNTSSLGGNLNTYSKQQGFVMEITLPIN